MPYKKLPTLKNLGPTPPKTVNGRTIDVSVVSGLSTIPFKQAQQFLGIRHHNTLRRAMLALNILAPLTEEDLKKLFALKALLSFVQGNRQYTRQVMACIVMADNHHLVLREKFNFDLDQQFTLRQYDFQDRNQRTTC